ncbi:MAG TPA: multidrug transporter [Spirochaetia bacterium]|nr:multidrug transporter [Spirochaetia bacterium]
MPPKDAADTVPPFLTSISSSFTSSEKPVAIILAAGQGKRIKSNHSKMLHEIWGIPTVLRVARAATDGLDSADQVIVVGIKAREVAEKVGRAPGRIFAFQREQKGTGHAVQIALDALTTKDSDRDFYVFPGDMGLIDRETVRSFREAFTGSGAAMMVMVGSYSGEPEKNYYGRIIRVPENDTEGVPSGNDRGRIIQIMEFKDIHAMNPRDPYIVSFHGRFYSFHRRELIDIREYNSGLYAFQGRHLISLIRKLDFENVQREMYLTDLIYLFNQAGLEVAGSPPRTEEALLGFNDKAVLGEMHAIARSRVWETLSRVVSIADKDDFFVAEDVVRHILEIDRAGKSHDIVLREGVYVGEGVRLSEGVHVERDARLEGSITLGKGVTIGESVRLSCLPGQHMTIGDHTRILKDDVIKGNVTIGKHCLIEAPVRLTGSDEFPVVIGDSVRIKGDSYIFGCSVADETFIVNCILRQARIACRRDEAGNVLPISYIFPEPEGRECVEPL